MKAPDPWKDWKTLVSAVLTEDVEAIKTFARTVSLMAWSYFRSLGVAPTAAEDMAESCATDITRKLDKFDGQHFAAWAYTIFRHFLAGEMRNQLKLVEIDGETWEQFASNGRPIRLNRQTRAAVAKAVAQLDGRDQRIVALRMGRQPLEFKSIGQEVGISEGAARVRCKRALDRLEKLLRAEPQMKERIARCDGLDNKTSKVESK